jgi:hypothetical protein
VLRSGNWNWTSKVKRTADKLYRDMTCSGSGDDLLSSVGVSGVLPFGGFVSCGREYQECVDVGVLGRG